MQIKIASSELLEVEIGPGLAVWSDGREVGVLGPDLQLIRGLPKGSRIRGPHAAWRRHGELFVVVPRFRGTARLVSHASLELVWENWSICIPRTAILLRFWGNRGEEAPTELLWWV